MTVERKRRWFRRRIIFVTVPTIAIAIGMLVFREPPEPVYNGETLTFWLNQLQHEGFSSPVEEFKLDQAADAIRHIGSNALPTLLNLACRHDSKFKAKLIHLIKSKSFPGFNIYDEYECNMFAESGFMILGNRAKDAVPALLEMLDTTNTHNFFRAAWNLSAIGPASSNAIPLLCNYLKNCKDPNERSAVEIQLGLIHEMPEIAIPVLLQDLEMDLSQTNFQPRCSALWGLEHYGDKAKSAAPALRKLLSNCSNPNIREQITNVLKEIDPAVETNNLAW